MLEVDVLVMYVEVHALHVAMQTTSAIALVVASKGNGDDDQGFAREIEPWESSEGGIYLLRELSAVAPSKATKFLPVLVELAQSSGYVKYHNLMETLFRLLPSIAQVQILPCQCWNLVLCMTAVLKTFQHITCSSRVILGDMVPLLGSVRSISQHLKNLMSLSV
jgi:hypothetical protein